MTTRTTDANTARPGGRRHPPQYQVGLLDGPRDDVGTPDLEEALDSARTLSETDQIVCVWDATTAEGDVDGAVVALVYARQVFLPQADNAVDVRARGAVCANNAAHR